MNTILFDIETSPLPESELAALVPPFDPAEVKTGNLKDPDKIAAKLAEAEANHRRDFFDRAALDPLTGRVLAIGLLKNAEGGMQKAEFRIIGHDDEAQTLREFWSLCRGEMGRINQMVGFNSNLFDLPFLIRRSWKHRVPDQERQVEQVRVETHHLVDASHLAPRYVPELAEGLSFVVVADDAEFCLLPSAFCILEQPDRQHPPRQWVERGAFEEIAAMIRLRLGELGRDLVRVFQVPGANLRDRGRRRGTPDCSLSALGRGRG